MMTKQELNLKTEAVILEVQSALKTVYDALNQGQRKKIMKDERVVSLMERYGVETNV